MFYVYVLKSTKSGRYYIGSTNDLMRRLNEHNSGRTPSLKHQRPMEIVFSKECFSSLEARRYEIRLKKLKSRVILDRIVKEGEIKLGP